ncbi:hypothetical protein SAMN05421663_10550 [Terribacillus halophilus]|uniref:Uncharacterized protein n=1 Tax=Terribacillus halophilus TaxID=361279 RepID=A0A1G6QEK3_9BACI|nr:hypothetical protein SAMN05421663_10550 [Terribacillus halophilus]
MSWEAKRTIAVLFIAIPLLFALWLCFNSNLLISEEFSFSDGYVMARTLIIIFTLYLFTKIGFVLFKSTEKK